MRIITDNEEVFDIPDKDVLSFNAGVHDYIRGTDGEFKRFINKLDMRIKSTKNIKWNDEHTEDLDFATRIKKYNDIRIIEFKGNVYKIVWKYGKRLDLNPLQTSKLDGDEILIHIKYQKPFKKNKGDDNNKK